MILDNVVSHFTKGDKFIIIPSSSLFGWWFGSHFFPLTSGVFLTIFTSVISGGILVLTNAILLRFYKDKWEDKIFKPKNKKDGETEKSDKQKVA